MGLERLGITAFMKMLIENTELFLAAIAMRARNASFDHIDQKDLDRQIGMRIGRGEM